MVETKLVVTSSISDLSRELHVLGAEVHGLNQAMVGLGQRVRLDWVGPDQNPVTVWRSQGNRHVKFRESDVFLLVVGDHLTETDFDELQFLLTQGSGLRPRLAIACMGAHDFAEAKERLLSDVRALREKTDGGTASIGEAGSADVVTEVLEATGEGLVGDVVCAVGDGQDLADLVVSTILSNEYRTVPATLEDGSVCVNGLRVAAVGAWSQRIDLEGRAAAAEVTDASVAPISVVRLCMVAPPELSAELVEIEDFGRIMSDAIVPSSEAIWVQTIEEEAPEAESLASKVAEADLCLFLTRNADGYTLRRLRYAERPTAGGGFWQNRGVREVVRDEPSAPIAFSSFDAVKYVLAFWLMRDRMGDLRLSIRDRDLFLGGTHLLDLEHVDVYTGNLSVRREGVLYIDELFWNSYRAFRHEPAVQDEYHLFAQYAKIRKELRVTYNRRERALRDLSHHIAGLRQIQDLEIGTWVDGAVSLIEAGDFDAAVAHLTNPTMDAQSVRLDAEQVFEDEQGRTDDGFDDRYQVRRAWQADYLRALLLRFHVERTYYVGDTFEAVVSDAAEILELAKRWRLDCPIGLAYARYLMENGQDRRAAEVARDCLADDEKAGDEVAIAASCKVLGDALMAQGKATEAEGFLKRAVKIYRGRARQMPSPFEHELVLSLLSLSECEELLDGAYECDGAMREAISIMRGHIGNASTHMGGYLAWAYCRYADFLWRRARRDEAERAYRDALVCYHIIDGRDDNGESGLFSNVLSEVASYVTGQGRLEEAETIYARELEVARRLAEGNPAAYSRDLAKALTCYANCIMDFDRKEEAESYLRAVVDITDGWAQTDPTNHLYCHVIATYNLAFCEAALNRPEEAERLYREVIGLIDPIAQKDLEPYLPVLAKTLIRLADCLCGIGFSQETETDDTSLLQEMSKLLNPRNRLRERRRNKEARDLYYRGLKVQQRLANQDPEIYEYDYVVGLNNLAALHYRMGDAGQALTIYTFALSAYGRDTLKDPDTYAPIIAELMHGIAVCTEKVGREHDAAQWREDERRMRDTFGL